MRLSTFELHLYASKYFEITEFQLPVSFDLLKEECHILEVEHVSCLQVALLLVHPRHPHHLLSRAKVPPANRDSIAGEGGLDS